MCKLSSIEYTNDMLYTELTTYYTEICSIMRCLVIARMCVNVFVTQ